jgi:hypothetical protein
MSVHFLILVVLLTSIFPSQVKEIIFKIISRPMTIQAAQGDPPQIAFNEIIRKEKDHPQKKDEWDTLYLLPADDLNQSHLNRKNWNPVTQIPSAKINLEPMTFTQNEMQTLIESREWADQLPDYLKSRLNEAQIRSSVLDQDWTLPSWKDQAREAIKEAQKNIAQNDKPSSVQVYKKNNDGSRTSRDDFHRTAGVAINDEKPIRHKLFGNILLLPGVALGDRHLEIRHFQDGIPHESPVHVDLKSGQFSIEVNNLDGSITAEIFDQKGGIVASGSQRLATHTPAQPMTIHLADNSKFAGTFYNFDGNQPKLMSKKINSSRGEKAQVLHATLGLEDKTDESGSFRVGKVSSSSWGLIRAKSPSFSEALVLLPAGQDQNIPLIKESLLSALKNLINEESNFSSQENNNSVVWGQVIFDGKPLSGAAVRLLNDSESRPAYLQGWIPSTRMTATSANGYFCFSNLRRGMHTILAERNGHYLGHINVEVDDETVSIANIEIAIKSQKKQIKSFDVFTGEPVAATLQLQSLTDVIESKGMVAIDLPDIRRNSFGFANSYDSKYIPAQFLYSDDDEYIHVPMIPSEFLEQLAFRNKINKQPNTGVIIGIVPEDDFDVYLSHEHQYPRDQIVYFDALGNFSEKGVAGGGFVLFNVPFGTQSVVVLSKKTEMLSSQVLSVDPDVTSVLKFRF